MHNCRQGECPTQRAVHYEINICYATHLADTHGVHSYLLQTDPAHHTLTRTDGSTWTADSTLVTVDKIAATYI